MSGDDTVTFRGTWTADSLTGDKRPTIDPRSVKQNGPVRLMLSELDSLDMFGAAAIVELQDTLQGAGHTTEFSGGTARHRRIVESLDEASTPPSPHMQLDLAAPVTELGRMVVDGIEDGKDVLTVQGHVLVSTFRLFAGRGHVRLPSVVNELYDIVLRAIPIVALISLVVGVILTQQSIAQLRNFGATIFVVDLGGILMLREVGILLAAIMVAGRSGSAITAEIGAMRMREEIDALEVMGLDTYRTVVMPRALALVLGMPALAMVSAIAGIVGSALIARVSAEITFASFIGRLNDVVDLHIISVGVVKAPFMAFAIAVIAVSEGLRVSGSTDSLGRHTTASVVKSIFIVIVLDGIFALFFEAIRF